MKCLRCGKEFKDEYRLVCDECGYDFEEGKRLSKKYDAKKDPEVPNHKKTDLIDYPILSFIFSLLGLIIPLAIFSILAMRLSKKPAKANLVPFSNLGYVFGVVGIGISVLVIFCIIVSLF